LLVYVKLTSFDNYGTTGSDVLTIYVLPTNILVPSDIVQYFHYLE